MLGLAASEPRSSYSNAEHGLPRTNADKRQAVMLLLKDEEWAGWNNCEIARACVVNESTVRRIREESSSVLPKMPAARKVDRNGKTYMQDTTNIGKRDSLGRDQWLIVTSAPERLLLSQR